MIMFVLGGVAVVIVVMAVVLYNKLVRLRAFVKEAWSGIDVQLKRRYDLIPNLVQTVKGYATHEKEVFENVTRMRNAAMGVAGVEGKAEAESGLSGALKTLFAVSENYPELKANTNFLELQKQLSSIENDLQLSRRYYNGAVRNYNVSTQVFPSSIISSIGGFKSESFFELSGDKERENPTIKF
jgi:LemA protein